MPSDKRGAGEKERTEVGEPPEEMDFSPSSGATDPEHAEQDVSEDMKTDRHSYTENQTYVGGEIPSVAYRDVRDAEIDDKFIKEDEDGNTYVDPPWDDLNEANQDFHANENRSQGSEQHRVDEINDCKSWADKIGLTEHEAERAVYIFQKADDGPKNNFGKETMILAALTLAANEGSKQRNTVAKEIRPESPLAKPDTDHWIQALDYRDLREDLNIDPEDVRDCRKHLHDKM